MAVAGVGPIFWVIEDIFDYRFRLPKTELAQLMRKVFFDGREVYASKVLKRTVQALDGGPETKKYAAAFTGWKIPRIGVDDELDSKVREWIAEVNKDGCLIVSEDDAFRAFERHFNNQGFIGGITAYGGYPAARDTRSIPSNPSQSRNAEGIASEPRGMASNQREEREVVIRQSIAEDVFEVATNVEAFLFFSAFVLREGKCYLQYVAGSVLREAREKGIDLEWLLEDVLRYADAVRRGVETSGENVDRFSRIRDIVNRAERGRDWEGLPSLSELGWTSARLLGDYGQLARDVLNHYRQLAMESTDERGGGITHGNASNRRSRRRSIAMNRVGPPDGNESWPAATGNHMFGRSNANARSLELTECEDAAERAQQGGAEY